MIFIVTIPEAVGKTRFVIGCEANADGLVAILHNHGVACSKCAVRKPPKRSTEEEKRASAWMTLLFAPTPRTIQ